MTDFVETFAPETIFFTKFNEHEFPKEQIILLFVPTTICVSEPHFPTQ